MKYVDFGKTAADYGKHRAGFPAEFFWEMQRLGIGMNGQSVVDLGTGTGTIARQLARQGCDVTGIDRSEDMLRTARELATRDGVAVDFRAATAEDTGLGDGAFDVVCAGQCWHWFDRARAAAESHRMLRPGGVLVIAHFDWIPLPGNVVDATERLILEHSPKWQLAGGLGIHPRMIPQVSQAGFGALRTFSFDLDVPYTHEAWRGRVRASAGIGPVLSPDAVEKFDAAHADMLASAFPADPLAVPHRVWALIGYKASRRREDNS